MRESEEGRPSTPLHTPYPSQEESWESASDSGTYQPPPPYLGSIPTKPGKAPLPEKS